MGFTTVERPMRSRPSIHKLFFTIYPDAAAVRRIARLQRDIRDRAGLWGRPTAMARLHISLNGLGVFDARPGGLVAKACEAVSHIRTRSFVVAFNTVKSWSGAPRPLVMLADEGDYGVRRLHSDIHEALAESGLVHGRERQFTPHLTLLRDWTETPEEMISSVEWRVREFRLVDSMHGEGRHDPLGRWTLY